MFENGMEGMQEYCRMIVEATNTMVYMIRNTHWLKCLAAEMNFIEGVEIEGYYVLFHPVRVWVISYAYGISHTRMGIFPIPYAYGHPLRV